MHGGSCFWSCFETSALCADHWRALAEGAAVHTQMRRPKRFFVPLQCLEFLAASDHAPSATVSGVSNGPMSTIATFLQRSVSAAGYYRPGPVESHTLHARDDSHGIACIGSRIVPVLRHS